MSKDMQKDEFILQGGICTVNMGDVVGEITQLNIGQLQTTITISPTHSLSKKEIHKTEDADFEIIPNEKKPPKLIGS
jgi:hypothetical protein